VPVRRSLCRVATPPKPNVAYRAALGGRIRRARVRAGLSQEALAIETGMSTRYVGGIERGETNPSVEQIVRLAYTLGMQPGSLLPRIDHTTGRLAE
jgi:transcriptional regulator with XRE-family HTH domain